MKATTELAADVGTVPACQALNVPRASFYRWHKPARDDQPAQPRKSDPRGLSDPQRQEVLEVLHSERFVDKAPAEIYATLLDQGVYLCCVRTMYRILGEQAEVRERRDQLRHPNYHKPELLATAPNQVWSWDITKLLGPAKWSYFYLYVILDIFSRYVVGWMLATRESADLAQRLIRESVEKQNIESHQLTIHSDRGPSMKSQTVAQLLATLGVTKSHSRPHVSNDNPFSESQFKTLKYRPGFPHRFFSLEQGLAFCRDFFRWYNDQHYHSGIGMLTPATVHFGRTAEVLSLRQRVLDAAYVTHPERFVNKPPKPSALPHQVWINPPKDHATESTRPEPLIETTGQPDAYDSEIDPLESRVTHDLPPVRLLTPADSPLGLNNPDLSTATENLETTYDPSGSLQSGGAHHPNYHAQAFNTHEAINSQHFFRPQPPHPYVGGEDEKNAAPHEKFDTNLSPQLSQTR